MVKVEIIKPLDFIDIFEKYESEFWCTINCAGVAMLDGAVLKEDLICDKETLIISFNIAECLQSIDLKRTTLVSIKRYNYLGEDDCVEVKLHLDCIDSEAKFTFILDGFKDNKEYIEEHYLQELPQQKIREA